MRANGWVIGDDPSLRDYCGACERLGKFLLCCEEHQARMCPTCVDANHGAGEAVTVPDVRAALADLLTPGAGDEWLHCRIPALANQRPVDLIAAGDGQRVLDLIDAMKDGVFL